MNAAHLHLALNHLPVIGSLFAALLLGWALLRPAYELKRAAVGAVVLVALTGFPAYFTGEPAEDFVKPLPEISKALVHNHEEAAEKSFTVLFVVGVAALAALLWTGRDPVPKWVCVALLAAMLAVVGLMGWTANLGGKIRHPEIWRPVKLPLGE